MTQQTNITTRTIAKIKKELDALFPTDGDTVTAINNLQINKGSWQYHFADFLEVLKALKKVSRH